MTSSTTQPTFLQRILGRNYKWWYLLTFSFKSTSNYRTSNIFQWLSYLVLTGANLAVWWVNYQGGSRIAEFNYIFTYFVVGLIFNLLFEIGFGRKMSEDIKSGLITSKLLNTSNVWLQYFFDSLGAKLFWNLDVFIWILVAILGHQFFVFTSFWNLFLAILMLFLGAAMSSFINVILGSMAFFFVDIRGMQSFVNSLDTVSSGKILPLNLFWITNLLIFIPFSFTFYHPMQIYLGKYSPDQTLWVFVGGIIWCIILYFLAKIVFKLGLKRNESVGL